MRVLIGWIKDLWRGNAPLWVAFWIVSFLIGNGLVFALETVFPANLDPQTSPVRMFLGVLLGLPLAAGWLVLAPVSVWRCAPNTSSRLWTILARLVIIVSVSATLLPRLYVLIAGDHR